MPRNPRLDSVGALHHVMARGIERTKIFRDRHDRNDLLARLAGLVDDEALVVYAWSLMDNHFHLLVRTAKRPLSSSMRSLMSGYASQFNRRHGRAGHLFQNRFKSIICEDERYFTELVRYIHLNPLRAGLVRDLRALDSYRFSGHSAMVGKTQRHWQDVDAVLGRFGRPRRQAIDRYREFVSDGSPRDQRPELTGGGLVRSVGGWEAVTELGRAREDYLSDERVLGSSEFVERLLAEAEKKEQRQSDVALDTLVNFLANAIDVLPEALRHGSRSHPVSAGRAELCWIWTRLLGRSGSSLAHQLGLAPQSIAAASARHAAKGLSLRPGLNDLCFGAGGRSRRKRSSRVSEKVAGYDLAVPTPRPQPHLRQLVRFLAKETGVPMTHLLDGRRNRSASAARAELCWIWTRFIGQSGHELARKIQVTPQSVHAAAKRHETSGAPLRKGLASALK